MKIEVINLIFCVLFFTSVSASSSEEYRKQEVQIEMRDGIKLHTEIFYPKNVTEPLPILITRTPYGLGHDEAGIHRYLSSSYGELAKEKYIFVFQDIRGRYKSEGSFVMMRPSRDQGDPNSIDESTDTYDTIDWLMKNVKGHNGRAGILGISYGGWLAVMALVEKHPALVAAAPQASPSDMYLGDDFLHNGALRLSPAFGYAALMESAKTNAPFKYDQYDTYEFFLEMGALKNGNQKYFHGKLPSWNNFMNHPNYDDYWQNLNVDHNLKDVPCPVLNVAGWWDAEDFYGPVKIYDVLETFDTNDQNFLVIGPWRHGGWSRDSGDKLGAIEFEEETGSFYRKEIEARWFAFHLKGKGTWDINEALTFRTGSNEWVQTANWPPTEIATNRNLYLDDNYMLDFDQAEVDSHQYDEYISDPDNPVPYSKRPIQGFWQHISSKALWKVEDQRFVDGRPDVLSFETEALKKDLTISGKIIANIYASTSGTDSDWIVKVIDVYPENIENPSELSGYQLMISDEVLRAKYRSGFEKPVAVPANEVIEYSIDLHTHNHTFKKGHKIMLQIQSTWFPLIDRNPQKFVDIPDADTEDYQKAVQRIYHSEEYPSHVVLPVVDD